MGYYIYVTIFFQKSPPPKKTRNDYKLEKSTLAVPGKIYFCYGSPLVLTSNNCKNKIDLNLPNLTLPK